MPFLTADVFKSLILDAGVKNVASHLDADGIASAVLIYYAIKPHPKKISFEGNFHNVRMSDGSIADLALDKVPPIDYTNFVIDHHFHPQEAKYKLYYDKKPTSLLVLDLFKNEIPKEQRWKCVVGAKGDLESYKVPDYIWLENPFLLEERTVPFSRYGKIKMYPTPIYQKISVPINTCARAGKAILAFNRLLKAKEPLDLFKDEEIQKTHLEVKKEIQRLERLANIIDLKYIVFWEIETAMNLTGIEASRIMQATKKTTVVVNSTDGKISIRGILCKLIKNKLPEYEIGGHNTAMGGELPGDKTPEDLLRDLRKIFK